VHVREWSSLSATGRFQAQEEGDLAVSLLHGVIFRLSYWVLGGQSNARYESTEPAE